ncbi:MAG TPA: HAD-IA family hydrolase [Jatrophihabitans sp.]|jgi:putative hydrolase of the HAD superfamily
MQIDAVLFDFFGTLSPQRTTGEQLAARTRQAIALGVDPLAFDAELTATFDERFRGAGGDVAGSLAFVAARMGHVPTAEQLAAAVAVRLADEREFSEPRTEAVAVLAKLRRRGLSIGVISDCSAELPVNFSTLPIAPLVSAVVFSFVTGERKPHPGNYLACCAELGVTPQQCLYVGDGGSNELYGARDLGMRAIHLDVAAELDGVVLGKHISWDGESIALLTDILDLLPEG